MLFTDINLYTASVPAIHHTKYHLGHPSNIIPGLLENGPWHIWTVDFIGLKSKAKKHSHGGNSSIQLAHYSLNLHNSNQTGTEASKPIRKNQFMCIESLHRTDKVIGLESVMPFLFMIDIRCGLSNPHIHAGENSPLWKLKSLLKPSQAKMEMATIKELLHSSSNLYAHL
ncbi:hypothetical protein V6N11_033028 [Hibiscus sabdariffa]|uniref:Uncharacterized protein n=1 Tax=Hibiscus sabdariffa TaxID=183260 RepID=A0ABR2A0C0_9ROSI